MFFTVDVTACRHCGLCAAGCVCGLLTLGPNGMPYVEPDRESFCVHCGHCAAVCPEGAITLDGIAPDELEAADLPVPAFMARHLLKTRRAIRNFQPSAIDNVLRRSSLVGGLCADSPQRPAGFLHCHQRSRQG